MESSASSGSERAIRVDPRFSLCSRGPQLPEMQAMEALELRQKIQQLADDLSWLEGHCRQQSELAVHTAHLRLAAALARNVVGPAAEKLSPRPLFVSVVGGAGTGKSTVVNFLCGSVVAEANPQAGYTRHPTAFVPAAMGSWPSYAGFMGPLTRLSDTKPANLDEDVYQVKRLPANTGSDPLADFVVWDCPDMTTWASSGYVSRLMEVVGLSDVVFYVASDERYNDSIPTEFLHQLIKAGKAVIVVLTKMNEGYADAMVNHFKQEVLGNLIPAGAGLPTIPCLVLPQLPADVRSDPSGKGAAYRAPLINQLLVLCPSPEEARSRTVKNALKYLETAGDGLLDVARRDITELDTWRSLVQTGRTNFEQRYRSEFLAGETFRRFDRTQEQVLEMLELTGPGKYVSATLAVMRLPYKYAREFFLKAVARPPIVSQPESVVCNTALAAWLDGLQADCLRRGGTHPVWKQLTQGFDSGLKLQAQDRFAQVFRSFELRETDELDQAAKEVPEQLTNNETLLIVGRVGTVGLDAVALGATLYFTWLPSIPQLLLLPVAVSASRQLVELGVKAWVDRGRNRIRNHREALVNEHLSGPLSNWLAEWPTSGGSSLEKLQLVLRRVPLNIRELAKQFETPSQEPTQS
jgi:hypothetical protein